MVLKYELCLKGAHERDRARSIARADVIGRDLSGANVNLRPHANPRHVSEQD